MHQSNHLVEICKVRFYMNDRLIFDNIDMKFLRGKVTAVMGPSGIGKTTLLHLISGKFTPHSGKILVDGENISILSRRKLYKLRKKISMLFQSSALFTDSNVFENVAFPLREHTKLPEPVLRSTVLMKLEAVGLLDAAYMMPAQLSGGMARRTALARALALDPELVMFDEPFVGQDPITMSILIKLISDLNHALDITCIIVSHDISEVLSISDYAYIFSEKHIIAEGTPYSLSKNKDIKVIQFLNGITEKSVGLNVITSKDYHNKLFSTGR